MEARMTFPASLTTPSPHQLLQVSSFNSAGDKASFVLLRRKRGCVGMGRGQKKLIENRSDLFMMISGMSVEF